MTTVTQELPLYGGLPDGAWADVKGLRTWWTAAGEGPPVVLVYGGNFGPPAMGGGDGANQWDACFAGLAERHRVIAYDRPGMGWTDAPPTDEDYTMAFVVDHLLEFIESLECGPVSLIGHSRGGYITTRAALLRQDLVRTVTVINSGTLSPGVGTNASALSRSDAGADARARMRRTLEIYCNHNEQAVSEDWIDTKLRLLQAPGHIEAVRRIERRELLLTLFYPALERDKRETLAWLAEGRLQRPMQIIWGLNDPTAVLDLGRTLLELIVAHERRTRLDVISNCGHFPHREHPAWFVDVVQTFLSEVERDDA